jgi:hypothetical protein
MDVPVEQHGKYLIEKWMPLSDCGSGENEPMRFHASKPHASVKYKMKSC